MTSIHVLPAVRRGLVLEIEIFVLRDVAAKAFYFTLTASVFVFLSILITGLHP